MRRKAILIDASDVKGQTDLPGARVDIANWQDFLASPLGGSWLQQDVAVLHKPTPTEVRKLIQANEEAYCLVAFSGHGADGHVAICDNFQMCPLSVITPSGERGTLIADSCRGIEEATNFSRRLSESTILAAESHVTKYASEGRSTDFADLANKAQPSLERLLSSHRFRNLLQKSSKGIVRMLACAEGEAADEDPSSGGKYTSALLDAALKFHFSTTGSGYLDTKSAHDYATRLLSKQQNPEYYPRWLAFPFAIKVQPYSI